MNWSNYTVFDFVEKGFFNLSTVFFCVYDKII